MQIKTPLCVALLAALSHSPLAWAQNHESVVYRLSAPTAELADRAFISFHHALLEGQGKEGMVMQLSADEVAKLEAFGFVLTPQPGWADSFHAAHRHSHIQAGITSASGIEGFGCYETLAETQQEVTRLLAQYPDLLRSTKIGESWEKTQGLGGHDLNVLILSKQNGLSDKPKLFIHAAMHAREYATAPTVLAFVKQFLAEYGEDPDSTWVLDHHEVHVLLHMNPDGRVQAEKGLLWRKNTNQAYCGADSEERGVDLNRNFTYSWASTRDGSSSNQCSAVFRGPTAASEPETQAVEGYLRGLFSSRRGELDSDAAPLDTQGMHLDIHSYGRLVLYPWGHTEERAANADQLERLARKMALLNDYTPKQSIGLYETDGTSESVSYGELGIAHFTIELGTDFFEQCDYYENHIRDQNIEVLKYAAKVARAPYQWPMGPEVTGLSLNGESNPQLGPDQTVTLEVWADDARYQTDFDDPAIGNGLQAMRYSLNTPLFDEAAVPVALSPVAGPWSEDHGRGWASFSTEGLEPGRHTLYVQAQNALGHWGPMQAAHLQVGDAGSQNGAPVAQFAYQCRGLLCEFDASDSFDVDGEILEYQWAFSSGAFPGTGANSEYQFRNGGQFPVRLTVVDDQGATGTVEYLLSVSEAEPPKAVAVVRCDSGACEFDGSGSSAAVGELVAYRWQLEGEQYEGAQLTHQFALDGSYDWTLTVEDTQGNSAQISGTQVVVAPPLAEVTVDCQQALCSFDASGSQNRINDYRWTLGDGTVLSGASVQHQYAPGEYQWRLELSGPGGVAEQSGTLNFAAVTEPETDTSSGSGGGALGWLTLMGLLTLGWRRRG
ncbi:M14 family zinc carboxypeptidase [Ferrimonas balearica]|uniref:M14 family zinc carboxypeptidase n=1 Tax=Ferrimonas balearica TaxID=44012 RepID=UPI001C991EB1|nr:M14 family zinc carboxypeptidase [Ferrimonas balearica]MBY5991279.1 hypothetical protein [Ferrimonas balearica]